LLFVMLKSPPVMGYYYTPFLIMWLGMRGLVHGPSKTIQHNLRRSNAIVRTKVHALWSDSAGALGSRSTGLSNMVQEPRARLQSRTARFKQVYPDNANYGARTRQRM
jgi:hypothetical protein